MIWKKNFEKMKLKINTAGYSGYEKWREKFKIHVYFPQEFLS